MDARKGGQRLEIRLGRLGLVKGKVTTFPYAFYVLGPAAELAPQFFFKESCSSGKSDCGGEHRVAYINNITHR